MSQSGQFQIDAGATKSGGFVVTMDAGYGISLAGDEDTHGGRKDDDVGDGVVVPIEADGGSGEGAFAGIAASGDMLAEERGGDEGFMAALNPDAVGGEVDNVAGLDENAEGVDDSDAAGTVVSIEHEREEGDVFVTVTGGG